VSNPNATMFCDYKAAIDIADNNKLGDRSKYIDIAYHLVHENLESSRIGLLQVDFAENLADICTTGLSHLTLLKLRTSIRDAK
jgi:hypothetical protein